MLAIGEWSFQELRSSQSPQAKVRGSASFKWIENGAFLLMHQGGEEEPEATWLIGRDESTELFRVRYFDARGVSRIYEMSFKDGEWKM